MKPKIAFLILLLLVACDPSVPEYKQWVGKWNGPEGTYLNISENGSSYQIIISDLDGPKNFDGMATEKGLSFMRDNQQEIIHSGAGPETGMKWLADKKDCLIVRSGEGFCRN